MRVLQKSDGARDNLIRVKTGFLLFRCTASLLSSQVSVHAGTKQMMGNGMKTPSLSSSYLPGGHKTVPADLSFCLVNQCAETPILKRVWEKHYFR